MARSCVAQLEKVEAQLIPESWKVKFRKGLIPLLLLYGCGTEDKKKDADEDPTAEEEAYTDTAVTSSSSDPETGKIVKNIDEQLKERGWGCHIHITLPTVMVWTFRKKFDEDRGIRRNLDSFAIRFERESTSEPWDFSKPNLVKSSRSGAPEMEALQNEVMDAAKYGAKYIGEKYQCEMRNIGLDKSVTF